jgi:restriction system protein
MAIPDFQTIMLPLLQHLKDGREHSNQDTLDYLAKYFGLTDKELAQLLPSGRARLFVNRVAWAKTHLKAGGLLESPRRSIYKITQRGREVLDGNPERVDLRLLRRFPEYQEFRSSRREGNVEVATVEAESLKDHDQLTPEEHLEYGYQKVREGLAAELLRRVKETPPGFFERLVVDLLVAMGYGGSRQDAGSIVGRPGDGGIDGVIKEDRLGLDVIYVQAKRWDATVGRPEIQKFAGALQGHRAKKGVFITTSDFSNDAEQYADRIDTRIVLIDGSTLAKLMIDHGVGVTAVASYDVKRIDSDYFDEGAA